MANTLLQRTAFQCSAGAIGNNSQYAIDYSLGGSGRGQNLKVAIANDLVAGQSMGNSIRLTIYTPTGIVTRDVPYGETDGYEGKIFRVTVAVDSTVYIEFALGTPPLSVERQTVGVVRAGVIPIFEDYELSVTANSAFPASNLTPVNTPTIFRVFCAFDTAGVLTANYQEGGTVNVAAFTFNSGVALVAGAVYLFDLEVSNNSGEPDGVTFEYSVNAKALIFKVIEVDNQT